MNLNVPKLTKEQAVIVTAYTGIGACNFSDLHKYAEELLGHPIWTHQFGSEEIWKALKEKSRDSFIAICAIDSNE